MHRGNIPVHSSCFKCCEERLKTSKLHPERVVETRQFALFFNIVPLGIITLGPMMFKYCNPITEKNGVLVHEKPHNTYHHITVSKIVEFEFKKKEDARWSHVWCVRGMGRAELRPIGSLST